MVCSNCGKEMNSQSKFCPKCGASVINNESQQNHTDNQAEVNIKNDCLNENPNVNDNPSYRLSIPKRILSIIICIFIFLFTIISSTLCVVRIGFEEDRIKDIVSNEDILGIKINDGNEEKYLSDYIISNLSETITEKYNINSNQVDEILNDEKVNETIGSLVTDYISMFIFGDNPENLNEDSIIGKIRDLDDLIYKTTGYRFTYIDYNDIRQELTQGSLSFLIEDKIEELIGVNPYTVSMLFSIPVICIFFAVDIGLIVLLFKINNWRIKSSFAFLRITFIVSGSIYLLIILATVIISFLNQVFLLSSLLRSISLLMLICAGIQILVGFILFIIQNKFIKNKV